MGKLTADRRVLHTVFAWPWISVHCFDLARTQSGFTIAQPVIYDMRGTTLPSHGSDLLNDGTVLQGGSATGGFFDEAQTKVNPHGA